MHRLRQLAVRSKPTGQQRSWCPRRAEPPAPPPRSADPCRRHRRPTALRRSRTCDVARAERRKSRQASTVQIGALKSSRMKVTPSGRATGCMRPENAVTRANPATHCASDRPAANAAPTAPSTAGTQCVPCNWVDNRQGFRSPLQCHLQPLRPDGFDGGRPQIGALVTRPNVRTFAPHVAAMASTASSSAFRTAVPLAGKQARTLPISADERRSIRKCAKVIVAHDSNHADRRPQQGHELIHAAWRLCSLSSDTQNLWRRRTCKNGLGNLRQDVERCVIRHSWTSLPQVSPATTPCTSSCLRCRQCR